MEIHPLFTWGVTIAAGLLVFMNFRGRMWAPIERRIHDRFFKPHDELHERCDEYEKTQKVLIAGSLALLHDRVYQACKHYIEKGYIGVGDLSNLEHLYKAYVSMGGNGTCKQMYKRVCDLEYKEGDER